VLVSSLVTSTLCHAVRMGTVMMGASVSLDGFIADPTDQVGPLFEWMSNGDVAITVGAEHALHVTAASAEIIRSVWNSVGATVVGRRVFDLTNGWGGRPPAGDHVFVVTHSAPADWPYPDAPFTFVTDGVRSGVEQAKALAGERSVSVTAGDIGGQALEAGLVDLVWMDLVPVVLGSGVRFFGRLDKGPLLLENPTTVVQGDRVTHLRYPVRKS
jgi:dihydrofolate reductase